MPVVLQYCSETFTSLPVAHEWAYRRKNGQVQVYICVTFINHSVLILCFTGVCFCWLGFVRWFSSLKRQERRGLTSWRNCWIRRRRKPSSHAGLSMSYVGIGKWWI